MLPTESECYSQCYFSLAERSYLNQICKVSFMSHLKMPLSKERFFKGEVMQSLYENKTFLPVRAKKTNVVLSYQITSEARGAHFSHL